ncbi:MAG: hypothetical protein H6510_02190 [Acidobacteria bacterium]|nr:hypothetical protein [Acidobacteriota bacterium]MCB9396603.1 hypothetical protein [Acidobacteriota bacterium]
MKVFLFLGLCLSAACGPDWQTLVLETPQNSASPTDPNFVQASYSAQEESAQATTDIYSQVTINDITLTTSQLQQLEQIAGYRIPPGNYWYDRYAGAWGYQGGPYMGRAMPGLNLGTLSPYASGGMTQVFINGRALHPRDIAALQECTPVYAGRYWVDAYGNGGYEGGPAIFNLNQLCGGGGNGRNNGGRSGLISGSVIAGDGFIGFIDSEGRSFTSQ